MNVNKHVLVSVHACVCVCVCMCVGIHLGVLVHSLLHVLQQMVVGSALPLVHVDDAVQVGEVTVQVHALGVAAAYKPVPDLSGLRRSRRERAGDIGNKVRREERRGEEKEGGEERRRKE